MGWWGKRAWKAAMWEVCHQSTEPALSGISDTDILALNTSAWPSAVLEDCVEVSHKTCFVLAFWRLRHQVIPQDLWIFVVLGIVDPLQVSADFLLYKNIINFFFYLYVLPRSWGRQINWLKWKNHLCYQGKPLKTWVCEEEISCCLLTK